MNQYVAFQGKTASFIVELGVLFCFLCSILTVPVNSQQIIVGPNVHVSKARSNVPHYETHLAADPKNPSRLIGGSMILSSEKNGYEALTYTSFDGGNSWTPTIKVDHSFQWGAGDPAYAFASTGAAYFAYIGQNGARDSSIYLYRSEDGGKTWLPTTKLPFMDREYLAIDNTDGEYRGRIYVNGTVIDGQRLGAALFASTDGGSTFPISSRVFPQNSNTMRFMGNSVVLSDGTVVFACPELQPIRSLQDAKSTESIGWIKVIASDNGGKDLLPAVTVADWYVAGSSQSSISFCPGLAADTASTIFRDRLYLVWSDARSGHSEILLTRSSDKGKTWSKPVVVSDNERSNGAGRNRDNFMPVIAVNSAGVVGIMWYDRRDSRDNLGYWPRFAVSVDGGETFSPSVKVSQAPNMVERGLTPFARSVGGGSLIIGTRGGSLNLQVGLTGFTFTGGHTTGMAADAIGRFHPFWIDNRTGVSQIWTSTVTIKERAIRNGNANLQFLDDVSEQVALDISHVRFDPITSTISLEASLINTSKETILNPLVVRVIGISSQLGNPEIMNADNKKTQSGALWNFDSLVDGDSLKPGECSRTKKLFFHVSHLRSLSTLGPGDLANSFVEVNTKVLGKKIGVN